MAKNMPHIDHGWPITALCERTSSCWNDDVPPCDEAFAFQYTRVDRRTIDDPMKNPHIGKSWYNSGSNHRVEDGMIARDFPDTGWAVKFNNMGEFLGFIDKYGECVVWWDKPDTKETCLHIEIYDTYRE